MDIISFCESLVILIGFTLPIAHVAEIIADSAGEKWWLSLRNQRRKNKALGSLPRANICRNTSLHCVRFEEDVRHNEI